MLIFLNGSILLPLDTLLVAILINSPVKSDNPKT